MAKVIANLTLDTYQRNRILPLIVPQGDYGAREVHARITSNGNFVKIEKTDAVSIIATRTGDGESLAFSGTINDDGSVNVPITQWMLDIPESEVKCHIEITGNGYEYSTNEFLIEPQEKANPTEIAPDDPRQDLITEVLAGENTRRAAEAERESNENARIAAENARQSAEEQRLTDESTRITNEAQRVSSEASRDATFRSWAQDIASLPSFDSRISANSDRITNLEAGLPSSVWHVDDTAARVKDVPENARPKAIVSKIGGMTYKSKNLFDIETAPTDKGNVIIGDNTLQVITGLAICEISKDKLTIGKTYKLSGIGGDIAIEARNANQDIIYSQYGITLDSNDSFTIPEETNTLCIYFYKKGGLYRNIMLNEGSTALPYEPYFEGLRSAKVTAVKSVGVNLFDIETAPTDKGNVIIGDNTLQVITGLAICEISKDKLTIGKTYKLSGIGGGIAIEAWNANQDIIYSQYGITLDSNDSFTIPEETNTLWIYFYKEGGLYRNIMLNEGSTAQPYTPYVGHTLPIPEELRPANGINENVYDFIEWAEDGSVKKTVKCGVVDLGTLNWVLSGTANVFLSSGISTSSKAGGFVICDKFTSVRGLSVVQQTDKSVGISSDNTLCIHDSTYTDAATFKAAMSGVMLVYELAEPEVTDYYADTIIDVEGGGTLTFENEYGYDMPNTVTYMLKEVTS